MDLFYFLLLLKCVPPFSAEKEFLPLCCQIVLFDSLQAISLFLPYKCNMFLLSRLVLPVVSVTQVKNIG